jgi:hypothetical protein
VSSLWNPLSLLITLFRSKTICYGTDNISQNISWYFPTSNLNVENVKEYFVECCPSHITLLWIWIRLWWSIVLCILYLSVEDERTFPTPPFIKLISGSDFQPNTWTLFCTTNMQLGKQSSDKKLPQVVGGKREQLRVGLHHGPWSRTMEVAFFHCPTWWSNFHGPIKRSNLQCFWASH